MNREPSTSQTGALRKELRWFVHNRWVAGLMVILAGIAGGIWYDWANQFTDSRFNWGDESK